MKVHSKLVAEALWRFLLVACGLKVNACLESKDYVEGRHTYLENRIAKFGGEK